MKKKLNVKLYYYSGISGQPCSHFSDDIECVKFRSESSFVVKEEEEEEDLMIIIMMLENNESKDGLSYLIVH